MKRFFSLKAILIVYAFLAGISGLAEALAPHQFVGSFLTSLNADGAFMAQTTGVFQAGTAIIAFMARNVGDKVALRSLLAGFTFINAGVVAVAVQQMVSRGTVSSDGIGDLIVHGLMAVWFGYYLVASLAKR